MICARKEEIITIIIFTFIDPPRPPLQPAPWLALLDELLIRIGAVAPEPGGGCEFGGNDGRLECGSGQIDSSRCLSCMYSSIKLSNFVSTSSTLREKIIEWVWWVNVLRENFSYFQSSLLLGQKNNNSAQQQKYLEWHRLKFSQCYFPFLISHRVALDFLFYLRNFKTRKFSCFCRLNFCAELNSVFHKMRVFLRKQRQYSLVFLF